jgi:beta-lactamase regulating signal transducer with metallopeptidase domain
MTPDFLALFSGIVARTTATLLVALAATLLMRRASAAARHLVWTVALGGVLVLPFLGALVPVWRVVPVPRITVTAVAPSAAAEPFVAAEPAAGAAAAPIPAPARAPVPWAKVVAGVWMTGALLVLARLAAGVARIWWMERRSVELADAGWTSLADGLARRLRLGRIVTLLRGEHATVPMTWGIVRPVVLLPAGSEGWSDERRTVVLAHELAHIRRWDALTQWIAHVAVAAHWYNPLVWVAARKLRQEREQACDDAVLALGARPTAYADHLLDIVRALGASQGPAAALAMARRSQFEGRMLAILDAAARRGAVSRRLLLGTTAAAALLLVPLAALRAADAGPPAAPLPAPVVSAAPAPPAPAPPAAAVKPEAPVATPKPVAAALPASVPPSVLAEAARDGRSDDELLEVVRAARGIVSSAERRQVLVAVLRQPRVSPVVVSAVMDATAGMNESSAVREVLNEATLRHSVSGAGVRDALLRAVRRISSAAEQRTVLVTLMTRQQLVPECLAEVLGAVPSIASDEERRQVLVSAARLSASWAPRGPRTRRRRVPC